MVKFGRYELRTTEAAAARAFYSRLFGHERALIWPLHEEALARGAKPHWLGNIAVEDAERTSAAFVERGATRLGPTRPAAGGAQVAVLRDPGGAIVAVSTLPPNAGAGVEVVWHALNTRDAPRALENYCELFGWAPGARVELAGQGTAQEFAWQPGGPAVGSIGGIESRPGVHAHWIFFFEVAALEPAMAITRSAGGLVLEPFVLPSGERACVCDDPQGAAFALWERRPSA